MVPNGREVVNIIAGGAVMALLTWVAIQLAWAAVNGALRLLAPILGG